MPQVFQKGKVFPRLVSICLAVGGLALSTNAMAQTVDALWVSNWNGPPVTCSDPTSVDSIQGCWWDISYFNSSSVHQIATDGVNVYTATYFGNNAPFSSWSCPVADVGSNCTQTVTGPFYTTQNQPQTLSIVASKDYPGYIWIGQNDGYIWRCPSGLPATNSCGDLGCPIPQGCVQLDYAGNDHAMNSLVLANGYLFAGIQVSSGLLQDRGLIWRCDPMNPNSCAVLWDPGKNPVYSLEVGGGYLWAGLGNGDMLRCDPGQLNSCVKWNQAGYTIYDLSYDGAGTVYAAVYGNPNKVSSADGVVWSCATASPNSCSVVNGGKFIVWSVAAGAGSVFSAFNETRTANYWQKIAFGSTSYGWQKGNTDSGASLLYIPAGGVTSPGEAIVKVPFEGEATKLVERCEKGGRLMAHVAVSGPHGMQLQRRVDLCELWNGELPEVRFGALDPGDYTVKAHLGRHFWEAQFTVDNGGVTDVDLELMHPSQWRGGRGDKP